jgi:hypothetical protein
MFHTQLAYLITNNAHSSHLTTVGESGADLLIRGVYNSNEVTAAIFSLTPHPQRRHPPGDTLGN